MTRVIGLTGGIGSGKSTIARFLAELGAEVIDADKIGHQIYQPDSPAWREIVAAFGRGVLTPEGEIDRSRVGKVVFGSPDLLKRFNQIVHPKMYQVAEEQIKEYRKQGVPVVVLDGALLVELKWTRLVDELWVAVAPEAMVVQRLEARSGLPPAQTQARIRAQMPVEEKMKCANVVIHNDGDLDSLKTKIKDLWDKRINKAH